MLISQNNFHFVGLNNQELIYMEVKRSVIAVQLGLLLLLFLEWFNIF